MGHTQVGPWGFIGDRKHEYSNLPGCVPCSLPAQHLLAPGAVEAKVQMSCWNIMLLCSSRVREARPLLLLVIMLNKHLRLEWGGEFHLLSVKMLLCETSLELLVPLWWESWDLRMGEAPSAVVRTCCRVEVTMSESLGLYWTAKCNYFFLKLIPKEFFRDISLSKCCLCTPYFTL